MQSGSNGGTQITLTFERATNSAALCSFYCGEEAVDDIIHNELDNNLNTNDLFLVRDGEEVVAMFCIGKEKYSLFFPDETKDKMKNGFKPSPHTATSEGDDYWERFNYDAVELSLLAVKKDRRNRHIGSFIIEHVIEYLKSFEGQEYNGCEFLMVRALNLKSYTAIPFYMQCGFVPAKKELPGVNLDMYRILPS